ncbi:putative ankyrin repeat protein [Purpureocillium lavendulum]|uniref:Ankyrin repeat protein n=1 Tax=Purpureocillium lavendulum TaxID=1247861 RepID=A0AB34FK39_9HYPO|nr:putative ankyrin repeat protein [Purpureocillium lavendulum]
MAEPVVEEYTIGWICALQEEYEAACRMLDDEFDGPETTEVNDNNTYQLGRINKHNVVIGCLPGGQYGNNSAAGVARDMVRSFPSLRFALMVGIGGAAPTRERDIRLGDVVLLLGALPEMKRRHNDPRKPDRVAEHLKLMDDMVDYRRPADDYLYRADYGHRGGSSCADCEAHGLEERPPRNPGREVVIHYGIIASANSVMKDSVDRDRYANDPTLGVLCFEMEAAGLMNNLPCLVIRGISLTAAAYARELLHVVKPERVTTLTSWTKVESRLAGIENGLSDIRLHQHSQAVEEILEWLSPVDYGAQQSDYLKRREPGTGQGFLDSDEYKTWLKAGKQTLFCPGNPGVGKTILTAIAIDDLTTRSLRDPSVGVAYIYCNFQQKDEQEAENLLASLLRQLSQRQHPMVDCVSDLYNRHKHRGTRPSFGQISEAFQSIAEEYSRIFIIVDALDEYLMSDRGRYKFLLEILDLQPKTGLNFLATSRLIPEIEEHFEGCLTYKISATEEDMRSYIRGHMWQLPLFVLKNQDLQNEIEAAIIGAVGGMFLLAQLHFDSLKGKVTVKRLQETLERLPSAYNKAYEDAMLRIESQFDDQKELAKRALAWTTRAKRPLTISELQHGLSVRAGDAAIDEGCLHTADDIILVCAGLITIDEESRIVRLVHDTAKRYFEQTLKDWFPAANAHLATVCTTYLSFNAFKSGFCQSDTEFGDRLRSYPLYDYSANNWGYHAREEQTLPQGVLDFLENEVAVEASGQALMAQRRGLLRDSQKVPRRITALHLAAYFDIQGAVKILLDWQGPDPRDSNGRTPLSWAAEHGNAAVAEQLLEHSATDIEAKGKEYGQTPLSWAAWKGRGQVVELLLRSGANVNATSKDGRTPLSWAAGHGHQAITLKLVEEGAALEAKDERGWTPLWWGVANGHEAAVKVLLDTGANIDAKDRGYRETPLSWAAGVGHSALIDLLLANGADIEDDGKIGQMVLRLAVEHGIEDIVRLLLEKDVDIEARDEEHGQTPLCCAAGKGYKAIVQLLLDKGADLMAMDTEGRTPLLWAAENGHRDIVKLLLRRGIDVDATGKTGRAVRQVAQKEAQKGMKVAAQLLVEKCVDVEGEDEEYCQSLLLRASLDGHESFVRLLLEKGVDSEVDWNDQSPLLLAVENGHEAIARLLLEKGADVNAKDWDQETALSIAAKNGHKTIACLLLDKGAHLETRDNYDQTPLSLATKNGCEGMVRLLLDNGADMETEDRRGQTPLSLAAENGHVAIAQLMVDEGANLETEDDNGRTPLSLAAENGLAAIAELLVDEGANLKAEDNRSRTPLWWAAANRHEAIVWMMLEKGADLEAEDDDGRTPLSFIANDGYEAMVGQLLKESANTGATAVTPGVPAIIRGSSAPNGACTPGTHNPTPIPTPGSNPGTPNGNAVPQQQPGAHFRHESNHSVQSEGPGVSNRGNFTPQGGLGRGNFHPHNNSYNHQMGYSYPPNNQFRPPADCWSPSMASSMPGTPNMAPSQMNLPPNFHYAGISPGQRLQTKNPAMPPRTMQVPVSQAPNKSAWEIPEELRKKMKHATQAKDRLREKPVPKVEAEKSVGPINDGPNSAEIDRIIRRIEKEADARREKDMAKYLAKVDAEKEATKKKAEEDRGAIVVEVGRRLRDQERNMERLEDEEEMRRQALGKLIPVVEALASWVESPKGDAVADKFAGAKRGGEGVSSGDAKPTNTENRRTNRSTKPAALNLDAEPFWLVAAPLPSSSTQSSLGRNHQIAREVQVSETRPRNVGLGVKLAEPVTDESPDEDEIERIISEIEEADARRKKEEDRILREQERAMEHLEEEKEKRSQDVPPITGSPTRWRPTSVGMHATAAAGNDGHMDPGMVHGKVMASLNKMTPEKFDRISEQILTIASQSKDEMDGRTLRQVIQLTFAKATDEPRWVSMYAKLYKRMLETMNPETKDERIKDKNGHVVSGGNLVRKYLLNRCQEGFERCWRVDIPEARDGEEGSGKKSGKVEMLSDAYYAAAAAKRRSLGLMQLIGELYKLGMLTERIIMECAYKLLDGVVPNEAKIESLPNLLRTVGPNMDMSEKGRSMMDLYFDRIQHVMSFPELRSRAKFMLMDIIDLRKANWVSKNQTKDKTLGMARAEH